MVGAAAPGEALHDRGNVITPGQRRVGRAEGGCHQQFLLVDIHSYNGFRSGQPGSLDGVQTDGAAADHDHGGSGPDTRHSQNGAHSGHDAAADQASAIEGNLRRHGNGAALVDDAVFGVRADHREVIERFAANAEPRRSIHEKPRRHVA